IKSDDTFVVTVNTQHHVKAPFIRVVQCVPPDIADEKVVNCKTVDGNLVLDRKASVIVGQLYFGVKRTLEGFVGDKVEEGKVQFANFEVQHLGGVFGDPAIDPDELVAVENSQVTDIHLATANDNLVFRFNMPVPVQDMNRRGMKLDAGAVDHKVDAAFKLHIIAT